MKKVQIALSELNSTLSNYLKREDDMEENTCLILIPEQIRGRRKSARQGVSVKNAHVFDAFYDEGAETITELAKESRCGLVVRKELPFETGGTEGVRTSLYDEPDAVRKELAEAHNRVDLCGNCVATFYSNEDRSG